MILCTEISKENTFELHSLATSSIGLPPSAPEPGSLKFPPNFHAFILPQFTSYGYIQLTTKGRLLPPLLFGLFGTICPQTVKRFTESLGNGYKGKKVGRIVKEGLIQLGPFDNQTEMPNENVDTSEDDSSSISNEGISSEEHIKSNKEPLDLADFYESFRVKHDRAGILSAIPTEGSNDILYLINDNFAFLGLLSFFITAHRYPNLDSLFQPFGLLLYGHETITYLTRVVSTDTAEVPLRDIVVYACGTKELERKFGIKTEPINK